MFQRVILLLVVLGAGCQPSGDTLELGQRSDPIRNGTRDPQTVELTPGQILAIGWLHSAGRPWQNFCTGTLIAPRVVATARHCIEGRRQDTLGFGVGLLPTQPVASFRVMSAHAHPERDAALLFLAEDAVAQMPELEPIPMNRMALEQSLVGREVEAAGYGETYDRSRSGRYFAAVELSAITPVEVIVDGRGEQGICFGDSGGPVMMDLEPEGLVVLGVESWGDPSCVGIDHLIRLDALSEWVDETSADALRSPDPECEGIAEEGNCTGSILEICENGRFREEDCGESGLECRRVGPSGRFSCLERDVCAEVGSLGVCDGDTVVRCRFGNLVTDDCGMRDLVCATDASGAFCTAPERDPQDQTEDVGIEPSEVDAGIESDLGADLAPDGMVLDNESDDAGADTAVEGGCSQTGDRTPGPLWYLVFGVFLATRLRRQVSNTLGSVVRTR